MTAIPVNKQKAAEGKVQKGRARDKHRPKMPTPNYLLIICLILIGGTILVRTVAIAQHAYNTLLQPPLSGGAPVHLALASPDASPASATMDAQPVEKPDLLNHHSPDASTENASDAYSPAKREGPPQIASERHRKNVALRGHHRFGRDVFTLYRPWTFWW